MARFRTGEIICKYLLELHEVLKQVVFVTHEVLLCQYGLSKIVFLLYNNTIKIKK